LTEKKGIDTYHRLRFHGYELIPNKFLSYSKGSLQFQEDFPKGTVRPQEELQENTD
jgi:hypothetical protein